MKPKAKKPVGNRAPGFTRGKSAGKSQGATVQKTAGSKATVFKTKIGKPATSGMSGGGVTHPTKVAAPPVGTRQASASGYGTRATGAAPVNGGSTGRPSRASVGVVGMAGSKSSPSAPTRPTSTGGAPRLGKGSTKPSREGGPSY